jgi:hypothetical protein
MEIQGGVGALAALLSSVKEFVVLDFAGSFLIARSVTRTCRSEARLSLASPVDTLGTCCLKAKDVTDALACCEALGAPQLKIAMNSTTAKLELTASDTDNINFECAIKTVEPDLVNAEFPPIGAETMSVTLDSELLLTAFSQVNEKGDGRVIIEIVSGRGLKLTQDTGEQVLGVSTKVHIPLSCIEGNIMPAIVGVAMKDLGFITGFLSSNGEPKTRLSVCETGIRFTRIFFPGSDGKIEVLTSSVN